MIIDATDLIMGRLATYVAKKALLGEKFDIVNCEKVIITGDKSKIIEKYFGKIKKGIPLKGPYFPRMPDRLVRRTIRGMLPYKKERGRKAFENIMCHIGVPDEFKDKKLETIKEANVSKIPNLKYVHVEDISKSLGANL